VHIDDEITLWCIPSTCHYVNDSNTAVNCFRQVTLQRSTKTTFSVSAENWNYA